jgi:hypothetical protein
VVGAKRRQRGIFQAAGRDQSHRVALSQVARRRQRRSKASLPVFRQMLDRQQKGSLAAVAAQLLGLLENDIQAPFAQMRALFMSSDPAVDGFDKSDQFESWFCNH